MMSLKLTISGMKVVGSSRCLLKKLLFLISLKTSNLLTNQAYRAHRYGFTACTEKMHIECQNCCIKSACDIDSSKITLFSVESLVIF